MEILASSKEEGVPYWFVFMTDEKLMDIYREGNKHNSFYGYSDNKKVAKKFVEQRKKGLFYTKKIYLDGDQIYTLYAEYPNLVLDDLTIATSYEEKGKIVIKDVSIVVTRYEDHLITHKYQETLHVKIPALFYNISSPLYFKKKYNDALEAVGFNEFYRVFNDEKDDDDFKINMNNIMDSYEPDYCGILTTIFPNLFD